MTFLQQPIFCTLDYLQLGDQILSSSDYWTLADSTGCQAGFTHFQRLYEVVRIADGVQRLRLYDLGMRLGFESKSNI